jgi:RNA polymerase sigma-70 factor (ECF subfamily)
MSAPSPADDTRSSLLARVRNRDADAWMRLVQWIGPFVLRWCRRASLQATDLDEVCQEVLIKIWNGLAAFRKDKPGDSFRGWAYTITRTCVADLQRQKRAAPGPLLVELPVNVDPADGQHMTRRAVEMLLQDVMAEYGPEPGFKAFYRTEVNGLSTAEAAEELGMTRDVVRQHKSRWRRRLRDRLDKQFGELLD